MILPIFALVCCPVTVVVGILVRLHGLGSARGKVCEYLRGTRGRTLKATGIHETQLRAVVEKIGKLFIIVDVILGERTVSDNSRLP